MADTVAPEKTLAAQYDAEASPTPEPVAQSPETPQEPRATPPKDPETGRFVSPPPPETQQHSPRLVQWAHDLGMTDDDLVDIPADHLEHVLHTVNRQALARGREGSVERAITARPDPMESTNVPVPEETIDWGKAPDGTSLSEADYSPFLVRMFKEFRAELREMKQHINTLHSREVVRTNETLAERCDRKFAEYKKVLGDGTKDDFANDSVEMQRRRAVLSLVQMDKGKGSMEVKIDRAVRTLYGARAEAAAPAPAPAKPTNGSRITQEDWDAAALARPTARTVGTEPDGEAKAIKSVAKLMRDIDEAGPAERGTGSATVEDFI